MNKHQQHLYRLLKDVDEFCRKHGITYYCAGGTVIGAARHNGFIPWDDDIDIYMTRAEFRKFVEAFDKDPIPDRCIEYYEKEHAHHSVVNRFHDTTTTMFCHYHITGHACAGTLIDIFILDPIPDDLKARRDYIAKFWVLTDLVSPILSYSHRMPPEYLDFFPKYAERIKTEGIPALVKELSDEIFIYDEKECSDYCLRWGSIPLIYPIEALGEPVHLPFEDMEAPVPHDWYRYLAVHYGCDWVQLPYVDNQRSHNTILRDDVPYTYYYEKRDEMFSQDELMKMFIERKLAHVNLAAAERPLEEWTMNLKSRMALYNTENNMILAGHMQSDTAHRADEVSEKERTELSNKLYKEGRYTEIVDLYEPYIKQQTSPAFMGELMKHGGQYKWFFPVFIELSEAELSNLLGALLRTGNVRTCEKLIASFLRGGKDTDIVKNTKLILDDMNASAGMYYRGEFKDCLDKIAEHTDADDYPWFRDFILLANAAMGKPAENTEACSVDAILKAKGDYLWNNGDKEAAAKVYKELMSSCRNGKFYMDIVEKGVEVPEIPIEKPTEYTGNEVTQVQDELLTEIVDICRENNLDYCLGGELSIRLKDAGNLGYDYTSREIWMDAVSAQKFMEIVQNNPKEGRRIRSWEDDNRINDFCILYENSNTVNADLRDLNKWIGIGINIKIRVLRSEGTDSSFKKSAYYKEFIINLMQVSDIYKSRVSTAVKKLLYAALRIAGSEKRRSTYCRKLFRESIEKEKSSKKGNYYFYINSPGLRPDKFKLSKSEWKNRELCDWNGMEVYIAANSEQYMTRRIERAGNIEHKQSVYMFRDATNTWDDVLPLMDRDSYKKTNLADYGACRKASRKLDKIAYDVWHDMLDLDQ